MAMGRGKRERQQDLWIATSDVVETPANAFYDRLNQILDEHKFDAKVERLCQKFYKKSPYGRPSLAPGVYFCPLDLLWLQNSQPPLIHRKAPKTLAPPLFPNAQPAQVPKRL
jgi:hypothetical protein